MKYRPEVDGLRAIAVISVLLFHAGFTAFSGGFVGVDVFFVISGYLITTIILGELEKGTFSLLNFYERRFRRILPALYLVMAVTLAVGWFTLLPDEYKNLGQSVVATTFYANNMLLGLTSGYWDLASQFKPLLHTWSLGVEEQYYAVVPLLLMVAWRWTRWLGLGIVVLTTASLVLAQWMIYVSPSWAFYLLPTRFWELAIGALCAWLLFSKKIETNSVILNNMGGGAGLIGIIAAVTLFDSSVRAPGAWLLIPVVGASLVIMFAREGTWVFRFLSLRIMVFIGLISYSLYLWHMPVYAFIRIWQPEPPTPSMLLASVPVALMGAVLSWRYVERPFRDRKRFSRRTIFELAAGVSALFVAVGLYLNASYGAMERLYDTKSVTVAEMDKRQYNERVFQFKRDRFENENKQHLLVIGNSFGRDFVNMVTETMDVSRMEIVYRDDVTQPISQEGDVIRKLAETADVVVFASADSRLVKDDAAWLESYGARVFFLGTKFFGWNENWVMRVPEGERSGLMNDVTAYGLEEKDKTLASQVRSDQFVALINPVMVNGKMPITDEKGRLLSTDRAHVTRYGAIYLGEKAIKTTELGFLLQSGWKKKEGASRQRTEKN